MSEFPVRNDKDILECPRCNSPLMKKLSPFYLRGEHIGRFESLVCDICNYSALTAIGYDKAMLEARKFGLVGPHEEIISESYVPSLKQFVYVEIRTSSNADQKKQKFGKITDKVNTDTLSETGEISTSYIYTNINKCKSTTILIRH